MFFLRFAGKKRVETSTLYFFLHVNKNAELVITSTEPALWTRAPTTGFKVPVIASVMARKLSAIKKAILHLIVVIIRRERAIRCGSSFTSSSTSAMSAV